jgi:hypothetical protein
VTTTSEAPAERSYEDVFADAVRVMTEAARLTRPVMGQDEAASEAAGHPVWVETDRREPADWAEFVAGVLCAVAANVGSTSRVLAGRPGSWEADAVRQLISGTVGWDDDYLPEHRTEPVEVTLYVDEILGDADVWLAYDEAQTELQDRYEALPEEATEAEVTAADALLGKLEQQKERDWAEYGAALKSAVEAAAAAVQGLRVPVVVHVDLETYRTQRPSGDGLFGMVEQLIEEAMVATPLPGGGRAPLERLQ